ncbi:MAG: lytic transglycosylase domain-containing protein, partial [Sphingobium sp.]
MKIFLIAMTAGSLATGAGLARAEEPDMNGTPSDTASAVQAVQPLSGKDAYRAFFGALRAGNWGEAKSRALAMDSNDPVRAVALSELYTA